FVTSRSIRRDLESNSGAGRGSRSLVRRKKLGRTVADCCLAATSEAAGSLPCRVFDGITLCLWVLFSETRRLAQGNPGAPPYGEVPEELAGWAISSCEAIEMNVSNQGCFVARGSFSKMQRCRQIRK